MAGARPSTRRAARPSSSDLPRLAKPAQRALAAAGIATLADVARRTDAELLALHGMGPNALAVSRAALAPRQRAMKRRRDEWPRARFF